MATSGSSVPGWFYGIIVTMLYFGYIFFGGLIFMLLERPREVEICQNMQRSNQRAQDTLKKAELQLQEALADAEIAKAIDTTVERNARRRKRDAAQKERERTTEIHRIWRAEGLTGIPVKGRNFGVYLF